MVEFAEYRQPPHIIVVMIESISGEFLQENKPDGGPVMETVRDLSSEGFLVARYYANSIQTARGQFAALFSQIPSYLQKEFTSYADRTLLSLGEVLRNHGYVTAFIKAYRNINYDNSQSTLLNRSPMALSSLSSSSRNGPAGFSGGA